MSAVQLSGMTAELGRPIHRVAISKIESGARDITIPELITIAAALEIAPISLLFADVLDPVEILAGLKVPGTEALGWFIGIGTGEPAKLTDDPDLGTGLFWSTNKHVKETAKVIRLVEVEEELKAQRMELQRFEHVPESPTMSETQRAIRRENIEHARRVLDLLADEWRFIMFELTRRRNRQIDERRLGELISWGAEDDG